jgi:tetratricopeptide (TPR) repeat protein
MNSWKRSFKLLAVLLALLMTADKAVAQGFGRLDGEVKNQEGKPFGGVIVEAKHTERDLKQQATTDEKGRYVFRDIMPGVWTLTFKAKDPASGSLVVFYEANVRIPSGGEQRVDVSLKDIIASRSEAEKEELKKREAERSKFEDMKAHFDAGRAALDQARVTREELRKAPPDQKAALQEKLTPLIATAVSEFEQARDAIDPKDPNVHIVMANLGDAYEEAARYEEAASAFTKSIEAAPPTATAQLGPYYNKLGTALAKAGKFTEATAACEKGRAVDPAQAGACLRNVVIVLQNANKMKESLEAARKAVEVDPNNAEGHFFLARALVAAMDFKQEGSKITPIIQPGTAESYQKYLELAPTGRFAKDAQDGLKMLQDLGAPIDTKVRVRGKRP